LLITVAVPSNNHHLVLTIPAIDPNIIGASNADNTARVHLTTISLARAVNGSGSNDKPLCGFEKGKYIYIYIWMKNQTQSPSFSLEDKGKVSEGE
jgi:hypothetical protein